jgi:hypothetical protein
MSVVVVVVVVGVFFGCRGELSSRVVEGWLYEVSDWCPLIWL